MPVLEQPRIVHVFTLGGTASMTSTAGGAVPSVGADGLLQSVGSLDGVSVRSTSFRILPGASLTFDDLKDLLDSAQLACAEGADGIVVVQGTDTLEESAFFAELLWPRDEPIIFTGAMRQADAAGADGAANLRDAIYAAAAPSSRRRGVAVLLDGTIHAAEFVRKTATISLAAFTSPNAGPVGCVVEGRTSWYRPAAERHIFSGDRLARWPEVKLIRVTLGDDASQLSSAAEHSAGIVLEAFGAGHVPSWWLPEIARIARDMPVVLASRTGSGEVLRSTYGFEGSETSLLAAGAISAGRLDGLKARLLLMLGLAHQHTAKQLADSFGKFM